MDALVFNTWRAKGANDEKPFLYSKPKPASLRPHEKLFADTSAL